MKWDIPFHQFSCYKVYGIDFLLFHFLGFSNHGVQIMDETVMERRVFDLVPWKIRRHQKYTSPHRPNLGTCKSSITNFKKWIFLFSRKLSTATLSEEIYEANKFKTMKDFVKVYHVDFEKRGGCGVVARERHESYMSQ